MARNRYKVNMGSYYQEDNDINYGLAIGLLALAFITGVIIGYVKVIFYS